jgi:hypothetical protein
MVMVICILSIEGRREKGRIGCLQDKNELKRDLAVVTLEGGLKEVSTEDEILCLPRIT